LVHSHSHSRNEPHDLRGKDEPENLLVLCLFHHQQGEHGVLARARGRAPLGVTWRLGDTQLATWWQNERRLDDRRDGQQVPDI
jgi:hypothetical protein